MPWEMIPMTISPEGGDRTDAVIPLAKNPWDWVALSGLEWTLGVVPRAIALGCQSTRLQRFKTMPSSLRRFQNHAFQITGTRA